MDAPLFSFGVIGDVQFADADDAANFSKTRMRRYRNAIKSLQDAVPLWNDLKVAFVAQLGDLLDGRSVKSVDVHRITAVIEQSECKDRWCNVIGNHELYCFSREEFDSLLNLPLRRSLSLDPSVLPSDSDWRTLYKREMPSSLSLELSLS